MHNKEYDEQEINSFTLGISVCSLYYHNALSIIAVTPTGILSKLPA